MNCSNYIEYFDFAMTGLMFVLHALICICYENRLTRLNEGRLKSIFDFMLYAIRVTIAFGFVFCVITIAYSNFGYVSNLLNFNMNNCVNVTCRGLTKFNPNCACIVMNMFFNIMLNLGLVFLAFLVDTINCWFVGKFIGMFR